MKMALDEQLGPVVRRLRKARKLTQTQLAKQVDGYDHASLSRFERGQQRIAPVKLEQVAKALGVSLSELYRAAELETTPTTFNVVEVPVIDEVDGSIQPINRCHPVADRALFGRAGDLVCMYPTGSSMQPVLTDNSVVVADTTHTSVADGGMYVFDHAGALRVAVLQRLPPDALRITHCNPTFTPETAQKDAVRVIGKVIWYACRLNC